MQLKKDIKTNQSIKKCFKFNKNTINTDSTKVDSLIKENAELKARLKSVLDKFGVSLEPEIKFIGEF